MAQYSVYCAFMDGTRLYECVLVDLPRAIEGFLRCTTNVSAADGSTLMVQMCRDISEGDGGIIAEWKHDEGYIWPEGMTVEELQRRLVMLQEVRDGSD